MISVGNQSYYALNVVTLLDHMHSEIDRNFITHQISWKFDAIYIFIYAYQGMI